MPSININDYTHAANFVSLDEHQIAFWQAECESRKNVLFIHGFPSASCDWYHQWHALKGEANLLAMDMLGFGLSAKPFPHEYTLAEQAHLVSRLLEHKKWQHCHIVAHDYGDSVAQQLLYMQEQQQLPCEIRSISFLNGGLFSEAHRPLLIQKILKSPVGQWLIPFLSERSLGNGLKKVFGANTPPSAQELNTIWQLLNHHNGKRCMPAILQYISERTIRREDWLQAIRATSVPMQFINGRLDPISGEHMAQRLRELVPEVHTILLDVGHYPQLEAPEQVNKALQQFLKQ
ncbi:MAG: alpha/beta fold hydrolase [Aestuariibacter sp.]